MLIFFLLAAVLSISSSAPVAMHDDIDPYTPFIVLGRELPPCMGIGRYRTRRDMIWGCLTTIIACTWAAVHPNLPDEDESEWQKFKTGVRTMIYALIGPEFVTMWAMRQRIGAFKHAEAYNAKFFPGYKSKPLVEIIQDWFRKPHHQPNSPWTPTHGFLLEMDGLRRHTGEKIQDVDQLDARINVPEKEIYDKSKRDSLGKLVVIFQTTWFITQCLARWITHLPVTELETVTLAFAALNIITYCLWWYKPQNMQVPIRVREADEGELRHDWLRLSNDVEANEVDEAKEEATIAQDAGDSPRPRKIVQYLETFGKIIRLGMHHSVIYVAHLPAKVWNKVYDEGIFFIVVTRPILAIIYFLQPFGEMMTSDNPVGEKRTFYSSQAGLNPKFLNATSISGLIFGGLHMIPAWTLTFPSLIEKNLWRICSFCITVLPLTLPLINPIAQRVIHRGMSDDTPEFIARPTMGSIADSTTVSTVPSSVGCAAPSTPVSITASTAESPASLIAKPMTRSDSQSSIITVSDALLIAKSMMTRSNSESSIRSTTSTVVSSTGSTGTSAEEPTPAEEPTYGPGVISLIAIWLVISLLYVIARVVLLVLTFTTLRDIPQGSYQNPNWTTYLPHF